jgi:hypothetical protein
LVEHVFRLLSDAPASFRWLLLENVPFMLHFEQGKAMRYLVEALEDLGFSWAYRVIDARAFGLRIGARGSFCWRRGPRTRVKSFLQMMRVSCLTPIGASSRAGSIGQKGSAAWGGRLTPYRP